MWYLQLLPKASPEKHTLNVVEMQQLAVIGNTDSKEEKSSLKWTIYNGRRKIEVEHCRVPLPKQFLPYR